MKLLALCREQMPDIDDKLIEDVLLNLGSKIKQVKNKNTGETLRQFDAVQPYSIGEIREAINSVQAGTPLKQIKKKWYTVPTYDVALSGRMDTSCKERELEGAMSVAHSFTTHTAEIEVDWFTACDDLAEHGSGHISSTEFSSGVFYRYASINVDLLAANVKASISEVQTDN